MGSIASPYGQKYAYGYGRIAVLQQQLLSTSDIDRLLGAHDDRQLRQILSEIRLTSNAMPLENLDNFVPAMERWLRAELEKMAPASKTDVFHILWLREDLPVIAYYLKKFHGLTSGRGGEPRNAVTSYGTERLRSLIIDGTDDKDLPRNLVRFIEGIQAQKDITPQEIDAAVAQFVAHRQVALGRKSGSKLVRRYVSHLIDLQNIRTARRLPPEELDAAQFTDGGEIAVDALLRNPASLQAAVRTSSLANAVAESLTAEADSSVVLERGLNKGLAHDIAEMRGVPLSIEPLFSFAVIALSHILLVRTIIIGKTAGLSAEDIRTMLPPFFSTSYAAA